MKRLTKNSAKKNMDLEEAFDRLSCGLNAIQLMVYGLESAQNPYADGFHAVWLDLSQAEGEVQRCLEAVSAASKSA